MICDVCQKNECVLKAIVMWGRNIIYSGKNCERELSRAVRYYADVYNVLVDTRVDDFRAVNIIFSL